MRNGLRTLSLHGSVTRLELTTRGGTVLRRTGVNYGMTLLEGTAGLMLTARGEIGTGDGAATTTGAAATTTTARAEELKLSTWKNNGVRPPRRVL